ncbi:hypothetical protein Tco_1115223 [Tanacetum coccineum]
MNQNFHDSGFDQFQPPQSPVIHQPLREMSMEALQAREDLMKSIENFLKKFNRIYFQKTPKVLMQAWDKFLEIKHAQSEDVQELLNKLVDDVQNVNEELAEYTNTPSWYLPNSSYDDDDDEESSILLKDIIMFGLPPCDAITHDLPTEEPEYSLSMGDKHLDTISETKSDKVIKSSVENLVPIPSESEDFSDNESECDMPVCDDFTTFSNPLFDSNDDFTSSDDKSLSNEDVPKENFKMYSNPLFDDEEIISTKIDPHSFNAESNLIESLLNRDTLIDSSPKFDYLLELAHIDPIPPGIEEADFDLEEEIRLVENLSYDNSSPRPPKERNSENVDTIIESPSPSPIPVEDRDIRFLEELLSNDPLPLPKIESSNLDHFNDPSSPRPLLEPPDVEICFDVEPDTTMKNDFDELNEDECFNPGGEIDVLQILKMAITFPSHLSFEFFYHISPTLWILLYFSPPGVKTQFLTLASPLRADGISLG